MSQQFDFDAVDSFIGGAIGEPGARVFHLQVRRGEVVLSFKLEKQQVAGLARSMANLLADLPETDPAEVDPGLVEPVLSEWVVGQIALGYDEVADQILVQLHELELEGSETEAVDDDAELGSARIRLSIGQARAFVAHAAGVVVAGRPSCRLCGRPMDPDGHHCPRTNGHKDR